MKRSGFTMIELIFVIVILGILAAVALPKFIGVSEEAQVSKLKAYVGTLNRTVGPALWSKSLSLSDGGSIRAVAHAAQYVTDLNSSLPALENLTADNQDFSITSLTNCDDNGTVLAGLAIGASFTGTSLTNSTEVNNSVRIGDSVYAVGCVDGNGSNAPQFWMADTNNSGTTWSLIVK